MDVQGPFWGKPVSDATFETKGRARSPGGETVQKADVNEKKTKRQIFLVWIYSDDSKLQPPGPSIGHGHSIWLFYVYFTVPSFNPECCQL